MVTNIKMKERIKCLTISVYRLYSPAIYTFKMHINKTNSKENFMNISPAGSSARAMISLCRRLS